MQWFGALPEAYLRIEAFRREYDPTRPHRALQDRTPAEFAKRAAENPPCEPAMTDGGSSSEWYGKREPTSVAPDSHRGW